MFQRRFLLPVAAAACLAAALAGCTTSQSNRANYLWSRGFGWHANDNPVVRANPLLRSDSIVLGVARNGRQRPHLVQANLDTGTLSVDRLDRDADPAAILKSHTAEFPGRTFSPVPARSAELVQILEKLGLDRVVVSEPIKETTGSRLGRGVDTRSTGRIDPNTLPAGDSQSLNTN